ncbi:hypothetical protein JR316_0011366 [Psilocybe cubensis]|uniref:TPR-like protein n=2 Tax=Psilocybe cubensis TaxID=181762 RepID=A0A8H7XWL5_PSICU|nr:hypothetical protein JR316_0011366 [Psilocybe cubensis]KAH9475806.1 hypothetical protein JR316_0011366 [Psilocybe cubensis]
MSDPLSLVLSSVSLPNALEYMIGLAGTMEETFDKGDQSLHDLHTETAQISSAIVKLAELYNERSCTPFEEKDMNVALLELMLCCQTFPSNPQQQLISPGRGQSGGWGTAHDRVYSEIRELKHRINKCHTRFLGMIKTDKRKGDITSGRYQMTSADDTRKEISKKRRVLLDERLIAFVGSSDMMLSKLPPQVTTNLIADTYLRFQVDAIDNYLIELSTTNSYPVEAPLEDYLRPFQPVLNTGPSRDREAFRQNIIEQTLEIQSSIRSDSSTLSIQEGAWNMVNLSVGLYSLEMYEEAASMGIWTVNLFRTLVKTNPAIYSPYLVHALRLLSKYYTGINDNDGAKSTIIEAISISRSLQSRFADREIKLQLGEALIAFAYVLDLMGEGAASLQAAQEGVSIYENEIIKHRFPQSNESLEHQPVSKTRYQWAQILEGFTEKSICDYYRALDQLSFSLQNMNQLQSAAWACMKAVDIVANSGYSFRSSVQVDLAGFFYRLAHRQFHEVIKLEQALVYSQQSVEIYRSLCEQDRDQYITSLCHALYEMANTLNKLERYSEAVAVWQEISELAKDINDEQAFRADALNELSWSYRKLDRHSEAATIRTESITVYQTALDSKSDKAAHGYFDLGVDLRLAGRFSDAIEALHMALTKYRALAFSDPDQYTKSIASTLNQLTLNLLHSNRHDEALSDGYESLQLHSTLIEKDLSIVPQYKFALQLNFDLAQVIENETKCIERAQYSVDYARILAERSPNEGNAMLVQAFFSRAYVFSRFERLSEASTAIQEGLDWFDSHPYQNAREAELHIHCLIQACATAFNQGLTRKPLEFLEKAIEVGRSRPLEPAIIDLLVGCMYRRAQVFGLMGRFADAANASVECESLARPNVTSCPIEFVSCLRVCSLAARDTKQFQKAVDYIEEALELCHSEDFMKATKTASYGHVLEADCLCCLSDALEDIGQKAEALSAAKKALDYAEGLRNKYATLPWSEIESSYIDAKRTLADRLAANNELSQAAELIFEVRSYYEKLVDGRKGLSLSFTSSLYSETIICCAAGRHADGIAARTKLLEFQRRLEMELPELAEQTHILLDKIQTYPFMIGLLAQLDLSCGHPQEIIQGAE